MHMVIDECAQFEVAVTSSPLSFRIQWIGDGHANFFQFGCVYLYWNVVCQGLQVRVELIVKPCVTMRLDYVLIILVIFSVNSKCIKKLVIYQLAYNNFGLTFCTYQFMTPTYEKIREEASIIDHFKGFCAKFREVKEGTNFLVQDNGNREDC